MPKKDKPKTSPKPRLIDDVVGHAVEPEVDTTSSFPFRVLMRRRKVLLLKKLRYIQKYLVVITGAILLVAAALIFKSNIVSTYNPVPASIRESANFNVYYPNPNQLPLGYVLDTTSFESNNQAVLYTVSFGNNQHLIFTVQKKPSTSEIQGFYRVHLPLTISFKTNVGTAQIGVINNESIVSLPTNTNAWILMTAPLNANQAAIKQVLQSMTDAGN